MKPDQERVKNLLTDTVTLLCRNGLSFQDELKVEGLIGITLDNHEVFLVHVNEKFGPGGVPIRDNCTTAPVRQKDSSPDVIAVEPPSKPASQSSSNRPRVSHSSSPAQTPSKPPSTATHPKTLVNLTPDGVVIKKEKDLEEVKSEMRGTCAFDRNNSTNSRVPPLHGTDSGAFADTPGGFPQNRRLKHEPGEASWKRRASDTSSSPYEASSKRRASETSSTPYITGLVMGNVHSQSPSSNHSWAATLPPDMAAQVSDGNMSLDAMQQGSWIGSTGNPMPGTSSQLMVPEQMMVQGAGFKLYPITAVNAPRRRRPSIYALKEFECPIQGCGKRFYHRRNLCYHQRAKHGYLTPPHIRRHPRSGGSDPVTVTQPNRRHTVPRLAASDTNEEETSLKQETSVKQETSLEPPDQDNHQLLSDQDHNYHTGS